MKKTGLELAEIDRELKVLEDLDMTEEEIRNVFIVLKPFVRRLRR